MALYVIITLESVLYCPDYLELNELSPGRTKKTEINIFYERTADKN